MGWRRWRVSKIAPTYWHEMQCDKYQEEGGSSGPPTSRARRFSPFSSGRVAPQRPPAAGDGSVPRQAWSAAPAIAVVEAKTAPARGPPGWRRFAVSTIAAAMVAASLIGMYFRAEVASYVTQYAGQQDTVGIGTVVMG